MAVEQRRHDRSQIRVWILECFPHHDVATVKVEQTREFSDGVPVIIDAQIDVRLLDMTA